VPVRCSNLGGLMGKILVTRVTTKEMLRGDDDFNMASSQRMEHRRLVFLNLLLNPFEKVMIY